MIVIPNLKLAPGADEAALKTLAAKALKIPPDDITALRIRKKSLDARRKDDIHYVYTVGRDRARRRAAARPPLPQRRDRPRKDLSHPARRAGRRRAP